MTNKEEQTSKRIKRNTVKYILKVRSVCIFSNTHQKLLTVFLEIKPKWISYSCLLGKKERKKG